MVAKDRAEGATPWPGVLVVETGRWQHTRHALTVPATLVGQAVGCDVRLDVAGIGALHCVLVPSPDGLQVRDLNTEAGTFVNDERVNAAVLQAGDRLKVGPFEFRYEPPTASRFTSDRDALRIQVAAVAAQQTALDEEEARLCQRRGDLERQEEQLAAHLDEQRRGLEERERWVQQQAAAVAAARSDLEGRQTALHQDRHRFEGERGAFVAAAQRLAADQARCNTERELQARTLEAARKRWARRRRREAVALRARVHALSAGERQLGRCRVALAREIAAWRSEQEILTHELHGLTQRVTHLRGKIAAPTTPERRALVTFVDAPIEWPTRFELLDRMADDLSDQRSRLVEQWERLVRVEADWYEAHDRAANDLEALAQGLMAREETLQQREILVSEREEALRGRHDAFAPAWQAIQVWRARLQSRERSADQERQQSLDALRQREERVEEQLAHLDALQQQWEKNRQDEQAQLQSERSALEKRRHALDQLQQEWAERMQSVPVPTTAVEILRAVTNAQASLKTERTALAEERRATLQAAERHEVAAAGQHDRERFLDHKAALLEVCRARMDQDRRRLETERRRAEEKLVALQTELDGMVRTLLDDGEPVVLPLDRAA